MNKKMIMIDWTHSGTGATKIERAIVWTFGMFGAVILAQDVLEGVTANSLNNCKHFYHSPLSLKKQE
ncbi:hypothetical protein [Candidatus Villigracilis saccharophilus]|uniref:hypothetical protein n=1 Tax=Candidatus Villigracilis saccharophilus TaxID=3140684 RepID=UPI003136DD11|nr:hypothetical protein [Anaerolineales bacterium]